LDEQPEIEIRPIEPEEYETAAELIKGSLGEYDAFDFDPNTSDLAPERMEDLYEEPKGRLWVAEANDSLVGTIGLRRVDDRACKLTRLWVHPDYRRYDVAQQLETTLADYAREAGFRRLITQTTTRQEPAAAFLGSAGYAEFKRTLVEKTVVITFEKTL